MKQLALFSLVLIALTQTNYGQSIPDSALYLGQTPPGNTPIVFAPGVVSVPGRVENAITFSPDSTHIFFSTGDWPTRVIRYMEYKDEAWTSPVVASFSAGRSTDEPLFSPNGTRVYYYAYAPGSSSNSDICYSEKSATVWGSPVNPGSPLNSSSDEYHPCIVNDSSVYFTDSSGKIYRSQYRNGTYESRIILPSIINVGGSYGDAYVSPDESYLIFRSSRSGGYGDNDIYISYKKTDGTWTNPKNLGSLINTVSSETSGDITPDGKYMTFGRNGDLYWVSTNFIDSLKNTNYAPYLKNQIKNQTDTLGHFYSYSIPDSTFIDDDGDSTITYSATLSDGSSLPGWLPFNPGTRTISGTLSAAGSLVIKVFATDTKVASASCTFSLKVVDVPSFVDQMYVQNIKIFPNPVSDKLIIDLDKTYQVIHLEVTDISGKNITSVLYNNQDLIELNMDNFKNGIYFIQLNADNKETIFKVLKK